MIAAGKASQSPPPDIPKPTNSKLTMETSEPKSKPTLPPKTNSSAKRKLVGNDLEDLPKAIEKVGGKKKKKKADKGLLSFNEDEES
jgi:hypothetical protein